MYPRSSVLYGLATRYFTTVPVARLSIGGSARLPRAAQARPRSHVRSTHLVARARVARRSGTFTLFAFSSSFRDGPVAVHVKVAVALSHIGGRVDTLWVRAVHRSTA